MANLANAGAAMSYDGCVEVRSDGWCLAQVCELPGCFATGRSQAEVVAALTAAIAPYYAWLSAHDDYTPVMHGPFEVSMRETVAVDGPRAGAFFGADAAPVSDEDLDWYLALGEWAYGDLLALGTHGMAGPGREAVGQMLDAATQGQLWLTTRLDAQPVMPDVTRLAGTPDARLQQVWQASAARLRGVNDDDRERVWEQEGERWSLRKVLRRSVLLGRERMVTLRVSVG